MASFGAILDTQVKQNETLALKVKCIDKEKVVKGQDFSIDNEMVYGVLNTSYAYVICDGQRNQKVFLPEEKENKLQVGKTYKIQNLGVIKTDPKRLYIKDGTGIYHTGKLDIRPDLEASASEMLRPLSPEVPLQNVHAETGLLTILAKIKTIAPPKMVMGGKTPIIELVMEKADTKVQVVLWRETCINMPEFAIGKWVKITHLKRAVKQGSFLVKLCSTQYTKLTNETSEMEKPFTREFEIEGIKEEELQFVLLVKDHENLYIPKLNWNKAKVFDEFADTLPANLTLECLENTVLGCFPPNHE